jgi:hypothetical protein
MKRAFIIWMLLLVVLSINLIQPVEGARAEVLEQEKHLVAFPQFDEVHGLQWDPGSEVTLTIVGTDYEVTLGVEGTTYEDSWVTFYVGNVHDLEPGDTVVMTDGIVTASHVVRNQKVTGMLPESDLVFGTADPGSEVMVWVDEPCCYENIVTAGSGAGWEPDYWEVDFSGQVDLLLTSRIAAAQQDASDSDHTRYEWLLPSFAVRQDNNSIEGWDWPAGAALVLEIYADDTAADLLYDASTIVEDWGTNHDNFFELAGTFDIVPGMFVRLTTATIVKEHVVTNLQMLSADPSTDTVHGTADPSSEVSVWLCNDSGCANRWMTADPIGDWTVDFSKQGGGEGEQDVVDIRPGDWVDSGQGDEDGDSTFSGIAIPNPTFWVFPEWDTLEGPEWPLGASLDIEIYEDDSSGAALLSTASADVGPAEWNPDESWFNVQLDFDILPGMYIVVSDGDTTKTHVVAYATIEAIDAENDHVSGFADSGAVLRVSACDQAGCAEREETAVGGEWTADFSIPGDQEWEQDVKDLAAGINVDVSQWDWDGDGTLYWDSIPLPEFLVRPSQENVEGFGWPLGLEVTLTFDWDDNPDNGILYSAIATPVVADWDPNQTFFGLDLWEEFDIQAGMYVVATNGEATKDHWVTPLEIQDVDLGSDLVFGVAEGNSELNIWACTADFCDGFWVQAGSDNSWTADFTGVINLGSGTWIDSAQWDADGDATYAGYSVPNQSFAVRWFEDNVEAWGWPLGAEVTLNFDWDLSICRVCLISSLVCLPPSVTAM